MLRLLEIRKVAKLEQLKAIKAIVRQAPGYVTRGMDRTAGRSQIL